MPIDIGGRWGRMTTAFFQTATEAPNVAPKQNTPVMVTQIREAIRNSGRSLNELAKQCGVSQPQLSRFLLGQRTLTLPAAARVCEALGLRLVGPGEPEPAATAPQPRAPEPKSGRGTKGGRR